jgi:hypothetical protein
MRKKNYGKDKNSNSFALTPGLNSQPSAYTPSVVPLRHNVLHRKYVNLLYIYRLLIYCMYTAKGTIAAEPYLLFNTILTIHHGYQPGGYLTVIQYYNAILYYTIVYYSILQYITATSRQYGYQPGMSVVYYSS